MKKTNLIFATVISLKAVFLFSFCFEFVHRTPFGGTWNLGLGASCFAQGIGINNTGATPNASALLDIDGTNGGLLIPRLTTAQATTLAATATEGLMIYNTTTKCFQIFNVTWQNIFCTCTSAPAAPTATAATSVTATSFDANWSASPGTTAYFLDVATCSGFTGCYVTGYQDKDVSNVTTYNVTGLSSCTIYYYRVRANNSCGTSANSNTISVTATACETDDNYTVLKLHMDGANGSTSFPDASASAHTVTANGNAQVSTAQAKFCQSGLFDGAGDYLRIGAASDWKFLHGAEDPIGFKWTFDTWVSINSFTLRNVLIATGYNVNNTRIELTIEPTSRFFRIELQNSTESGLSVTSGIGTYPNNSDWHHLAVVYDHSLGSNNLKWYLDGVLVGVANKSGTPSTGDPQHTLSIGEQAGQAWTFNGYIDEVRISKGIARWTSNFTPPAGPYCD